MVKVKYGGIFVIMLNATLATFVSKQSNKDPFPLFYIVVFVSVITTLAPVCRFVRLAPSVKIIYWPFVFTAGAGFDFHLSIVKVSPFLVFTNLTKHWGALSTLNGRVSRLNLLSAMVAIKERLPINIAYNHTPPTNISSISDCISD